MRNLEKNKHTFWIVRVTGRVKSTDTNGNYTGEYISTYNTPVVVKMNVFPNDGSITSTVKGEVAEFDYIGVTTDKDLILKDDLVFKSEPTGDYDKTYDYKVGKQLESLNVMKLGLKARV